MRLRRKDRAQPRPSRREFFTHPFKAAKSAEAWREDTEPVPDHPAEGPGAGTSARPDQP